VFYLAPIISLLLTLLVLLAMLHVSALKLVLDHPNDRSLHSVSVPRTGGLALMAGIMAAWIFQWQPWLLSLQLCVLFLMLLSFLDDLYGLSAGWRLLAHISAAGTFLATGLQTSAGWPSLVLMGIAIVWMTNLYNFMDGSDGLAGGMAAFGFGSYAAGAWMAGDVTMAVVPACIAASALAFLRFNFHPARIFMGDAGSIPLGFMSAAFGLMGWVHGNWPLWFPLLVFAPFIVDATITLIKRLLRGEKIWHAHRSHYYQRLVQMGWGHRKTALCEYGVMLLGCGSALWFIRQPWLVQSFGLTFWLLVYAVLAIKIDRLWQAKIAGT
jgi:UDP-GlcNAc:undecaprenyl-phosphate/decaprenyl-phosphate GlcNAc-1-phosphate transferase